MYLVFKRILSFLIDYIIILSYAGILFAITIWIGGRTLSPYEGQVVGFLTITLPVFLYFYLGEESSWKATVGKHILKISVSRAHNAAKYPILKRNLLKFLPWEVAHAGVHWSIYYGKENIIVPAWVWILLIVPQAVVLIYLSSIFYYRGKSSIYDKAAKTTITMHNKDN